MDIKALAKEALSIYDRVDEIDKELADATLPIIDELIAENKFLEAKRTLREIYKPFYHSKFKTCILLSEPVIHDRIFKAEKKYKLNLK